MPNSNHYELIIVGAGILGAATFFEFQKKYPVANPSLPFFGVHLMRLMNGSIECEPNAVFSFEREGYGKLSFDMKDAKKALTFAGTWKLFSKFWKTGLYEFYRAFSKQTFLKSLQKMVPSLQMDDLGYQRAGIRAQVVEKEGNLVDDFLIKKGESGIHVLMPHHQQQQRV